MSPNLGPDRDLELQQAGKSEAQSSAIASNDGFEPGFELVVRNFQRISIWS